MYRVKKFEFNASEIGIILNKRFVGNDIKINSIKKLSEELDNSMILCYPKFKSLLKDIKYKCLVFCTEDTVIDNDNLSYIITDNPKFDFFNFVNEYIVTETSYWVNEIVSKKSDNYPDVDFGYNVRIGKNVIISPNTIIGSNVVIGSNIVIRTNVFIGDNTIIKDNTIIGSEGFGFTKSEGKLINIPQLGDIRIAKNVSIGSNCTIERPALGSTIISENVKIDDLVQIGHNQFIGENTIIATGFKGIGGCKIGKNCFIGMGVTIVSKSATIGDNCLIGAGTILTKPITNNKTVYNKLDLIISENIKINQILGTPKLEEGKK